MRKETRAWFRVARTQVVMRGRRISGFCDFIFGMKMLVQDITEKIKRKIDPVGPQQPL